MKNYISTQTTDIEVFMGYHFKIDGEEITMYEEPPNMASELMMRWNLALQQLNPVFEKPETWVYTLPLYCDYAEFYIRQHSWESISVCTQFYDETDKIERFCDAKTFFQKMIQVTEFFFLEHDKHLSLVVASNFIANWKNATAKIKEFYQKYYV